MKQFNIPIFYKSPIISKIKSQRKLEDPRKKDFSPTSLAIGHLNFILARHFGFCYGVENAIEIAYKALAENPNKHIYLLSQMIHNPEVNKDLIENGIQFIQDTDGKQLIEWSALSNEDIVLIPAFGTTIEIEQILSSKGINTQTYNTTCPFVEKVWNRSEKLGETKHTIIIHGKASHEETRATFSHAIQNAPSLIVKDIKEAQILHDFILEKVTVADFMSFFKGKMNHNFDPSKDLTKIGVVNQTTMLATETQEITELLRTAMLIKYGESNLKEHIADTRDTLCYATNDNQNSTLALLQTNADAAFVIGGYNSSNTTHLIEILENKFPCFFIKSAEEILDDGTVNSFNIHTKQIEKKAIDIGNYKNIIITSGASCPDSILEKVIHRLCDIYNEKEALEKFMNDFVN